jgi:hypothetical protein
MLSLLSGSYILLLPVVCLQQEEQNCGLTGRRETKQKTLEEIAAAFGDHLVEIDENGIAAGGLAMESKANSEHYIEDKNAA